MTDVHPEVILLGNALIYTLIHLDVDGIMLSNADEKYVYIVSIEEECPSLHRYTYNDVYEDLGLKEYNEGQLFRFNTD